MSERKWKAKRKAAAIARERERELEARTGAVRDRKVETELRGIKAAVRAISASKRSTVRGPSGRAERANAAIHAPNRPRPATSRGNA